MTSPKLETEAIIFQKAGLSLQKYPQKHKINLIIESGKHKDKCITIFYHYNTSWSATFDGKLFFDPVHNLNEDRLLFYHQAGNLGLDISTMLIYRLAVYVYNGQIYGDIRTSHICSVWNHLCTFRLSVQRSIHAPL